jgi:hypothetical protein
MGVHTFLLLLLAVALAAAAPALAAAGLGGHCCRPLCSPTDTKMDGGLGLSQGARDGEDTEDEEGEGES